MIIKDTIRSSRFYLRNLNDFDVGAEYISWFSEENVKKFIENRPEKASATEELKNYITHHNMREDSILLGIFTHVDNQHIGNIKFEPINFQEKTAVVGVLIGDINWHGSGVFGEVFASAKAYMFNKFQIFKYSLGVNASNLQAIRAYNKAGFEKLSREGNGSSFIMTHTLNTLNSGVNFNE